MIERFLLYTKGRKLLYVCGRKYKSDDVVSSFCEVELLKDREGKFYLFSQAYGKLTIDPFDERDIWNIEKGKGGELALRWQSKEDESLMNYLFAV